MSERDETYLAGTGFRIVDFDSVGLPPCSSLIRFAGVSDSVAISVSALRFALLPLSTIVDTFSFRHCYA